MAGSKEALPISSKLDLRLGSDKHSSTSLVNYWTGVRLLLHRMGLL